MYTLSSELPSQTPYNKILITVLRTYIVGMSAVKTDHSASIYGVFSIIYVLCKLYTPLGKAYISYSIKII